MPHDAIRLESVHLSLGSGAARVHVLKGVDLTIAAGEAVGIVGPSGSGKSTLLMVMAGLEPPGSGDVVVAGENLSKLDEDELVHILTEPRNALVKQYQKQLALNGVKLKITRDALRALAEEALERRSSFVAVTAVQ